MAKQTFSKEELINRRARVRRLIEDISLIGSDFEVSKAVQSAALQFIASLHELIEWYNARLGEQIRE